MYSSYRVIFFLSQNLVNFEILILSAPTPNPYLPLCFGSFHNVFQLSMQHNKLIISLRQRLCNAQNFRGLEIQTGHRWNNLFLLPDIQGYKLAPHVP